MEHKPFVPPTGNPLTASRHIYPEEGNFWTCMSEFSYRPPEAEIIFLNKWVSLLVSNL